MPRYVKKPVVIEAHQLTVMNMLQLAKWCSGQARTSGRVLIETLEGTMEANIGDYIIKGVRGEFYPCDPGIFDETYERVEDDG